MSLINPALLWGLSLVSIPIILHFLLRSKPKKYLFPALRLIQVRRKQNIRRFRLKHLWLLLLRMAVLGLIVFAIARPTLPAANYAFSTTETLTSLAIAAAAIGVYLWCVRSWRRQRLPNHVYSYRRTLLRGSTGLAALLLFMLIVILPYQNRIRAEMSSPLPSVAENLPVAGVFLFDTSLSMSYQQENLTRLQSAQKLAGEYLGRLPIGSRIAVSDTSTDLPPVFQAEKSGALDRIQKLQPRAVNLPLADRIRAALALQEDDYKRTVAGQDTVREDVREDRYLREIYLFTDLTVSGWRSGDFPALKAELERLTAVQFYVIDVGIEHVTNAAILGPRLSTESLAKGSDLTVVASVDVTGFHTEAKGNAEPLWNLEIHLQNEQGLLVKREQRSLKPTPGGPATTSFIVGGLTRPITHGELRLVSSDPYSVDDVRYFTVAVTQPVQVLVVGKAPNEARYLEAALAPFDLAQKGKARYNVKYLSSARLNDADLKRQDVVCLVNVGSPSQTAWTALEDFVKAGGGLLVVAGNERLSVPSYNSDAAQAVLPARLTGNVKLPEPATLDLRNFTHPIFQKFEFYDGRFGELATSKIYHRWGAQAVKGGAVIATYTDPLGSPAIVERVLGAGHTLLVTTGLDSKGWSDLYLSGWRFVALVDQMIHYLSRQADARYNYIAGDEVTIPLPQNSALRGYFLRKPGLEQLPGEIAPPDQAIVLRNDDQLGSYEVVSSDESIPFTSGFSANASASESDFTRITPEELDRVLGKGRYSVAGSIEGLTRNVTFGRIGQEVFSLILGLAIAVFCAEHFVANRFYESEQATEHA